MKSFCSKSFLNHFKSISENRFILSFCNSIDALVEFKIQPKIYNLIFLLQGTIGKIVKQLSKSEHEGEYADALKSKRTVKPWPNSGHRLATHLAQVESSWLEFDQAQMFAQLKSRNVLTWSPFSVEIRKISTSILRQWMSLVRNKSGQGLFVIFSFQFITFVTREI